MAHQRTTAEHDRAGVGRRPRRGGRLRRDALVRAAFGLLATCLMLLAANAGASGPMGAAKLTAPYTGNPYRYALNVTINCASAQIANGPTFNLSKGTGRAFLSARAYEANACNSPVLNNTAEASVAFGMSTPGFTASNGSHTAVAVWNLTWFTDLHGSQAGAPLGRIEAVAVLLVVIELLDVASNTAAGFTSWTRSNVTFGNASLMFHGQKQVTVSTTGTLVAGQTYYLLTAVEVELGALVASHARHGDAFASVNMATGGNHATLTSLLFH